MRVTGIIVAGMCLLSANVYAKGHDVQLASNVQIADNTQMQTSTGGNAVKGDTFLEANSKKPGVITLPDGLQYKVMTIGNGPKPAISDNVTVDYAGTLVNGSEFDSSYKRGEPATFPVAGVIPGWTEALQLMPVGSTWMLYIPASLAYGERGAPPAIGPNETLIFKVHLIGIKSS